VKQALQTFTDSRPGSLPHVEFTMSIGRNDPCPCGSGKKYKKCCEGRSAKGAGSFLPCFRAAASTGAASKPARAPAAQELAALMERGAQAHQAGHLLQAEMIYREVLKHQPRQADALHLLGVIAYHAGRAEEAEDYIRRALEIAPQTALFYDSLGRVLMCRGQQPEAMTAYRAALRLNPQLASSANDLGVALLAAGHSQEAAEWCRRAVALNPAKAEAQLNLGNALAEQDRCGEAAAAYREALRLKPSYAEAHNGLGLMLANQGRLAEAAACFEQALALDPSSAGAHFNLALTCLAQGDWQRGFPEFEWRWQLKGIRPPAFAQPRWQGEPLAGRAILLHEEQGLGDTIQFVRYAELVKSAGAGQVIVRCQPALARLLMTCAGIDRVVSAGEALPDFDNREGNFLLPLRAPLLSLPLLCGTTPETIPRRAPYLTADAQTIARWRERLSDEPTLNEPLTFKIGICWQGNPQNKNDRRRSFPLACFAPLAALPGLHLVSLQKGAGSEQLATCAFRARVTVLEELTGPEGNLLDAAAVMTLLDLVITADTALAHLAGALGVPVWTALAFDPDWRWLREREDTPWYPSMRLFRQPQPGLWQDVFARMARELRNRLRPD
jgi:tetratricopeptide (TPR) repeat protein